MSLPPLSPEQQVRPRHFDLRIAMIYAALFVSFGVHLPYFPLWLEAKGFDARQIAIILSAPMFLRVLTTPFVTAMADQARDRANVLIVLAASALALSAGYFLEPTYVVVLGVSLALSVVWTPQTPVVDSLALSGVRRFGSNYAKLRIWGSISFLCANLGGGFILAMAGADAVPVLISAGLAATLLLSLLAPRLGKPRRASPLSASDLQDSAPKLLNRFFILCIAAAGVIVSTHGFMYAFVSIYWKSLGIGETMVGLLWAWAVVAEVAMFMVFTRILGRFSTPAILALAGLGAIVRWLAYPLIWPMGGGIAGFFAIQTLHAFSTALILLGVQKLIAETVPEERTGAAQGLAFFANGFSMAAVTLLSGPLFEWIGINGFFVMAVLAAAGLVPVALAARSAPERRFRR